MSSNTDFTNTRRELKTNLYNAIDCLNEIEDKYLSTVQLVDILTQSNYKKDKKIRKLMKENEKLTKKLYKLKEHKNASTNTEKEVIDLTQDIPQPPKIKIEPITPEKESVKIFVIEDSEDEIEEEVIEEEVVEEYEEQVVEEQVVEEQVEEQVEETVEEQVEETVEEMVEIVEILEEIEIEEQEEEEDIEPELEPETLSEPEENQPSDEPILEKEPEMELIIEDPEKTEEEEEQEEELYEVLIGKSSYYVANETNGPIYEITEDQEVGDEIGQYVNGKPVFQTKTPVTQPEVEEEEEEEEIELIQIKINKVNYAIENEIDGPIYSLGFDGDVDEEVGKYVNGKPTFYKK